MTNLQPEELEALGRPAFGDIIENGWASEANPTRVGFFVREGRRTGRMNAGRFFEVTDGKGKFWELPVTHDHKITVRKAQGAEPKGEAVDCPDCGGSGIRALGDRQYEDCDCVTPPLCLSPEPDQVKDGPEVDDRKARDRAARIVCDFMGWPEDGPAWDSAHQLVGKLAAQSPRSLEGTVSRSSRANSAACGLTADTDQPAPLSDGEG